MHPGPRCRRPSSRRPELDPRAGRDPAEPAASEQRVEPAGERQARGGQLFIVATPIGNLSDVTLRALEVLAAVPLVAAEDTRLTRRLLDRHEIRTRLVSYHAQSPPAKIEALVDHLRAGHDLAVVTDAGTPLISDPGEGLVAAWTSEGGQVVPIPGPSAVTAAAAASGVAGPRWAFEGFLPRSGADRRERLARIGADERATIIFEAPSRVARTLRDLAAACGAERPAAVCRELTKIHEQIERGPLGWLAGEVGAGRIAARGEFVIVVGSVAGQRDGDRGPAGETELEAARVAVERLVESGVPRGEAARRVASESGLPRRQLYGSPRD